MGLLTIELSNHGVVDSQVPPQPVTDGTGFVSVFPVNLGKAVPVRNIRLTRVSFHTAANDRVYSIKLDIPWLSAATESLNATGTLTTNRAENHYITVPNNGVSGWTTEMQDVRFRVSSASIPALFTVSAFNGHDGTPYTNLTHMSLQFEYNTDKLF